MNDKHRAAESEVEETQKLPAQQESKPGYTYENPNEDETYVAPEVDEEDAR